jgi:hypothetical protein
MVQAEKKPRLDLEEPNCQDLEMQQMQDDDESHRSTGGWFFFLRKGQGTVAAKSGQSKDIPLSSTESETIWGSNAAMQVLFSTISR